MSFSVATTPTVAANAGTSLANITVPATTAGNLGVMTFCESNADPLTTLTGGGKWARGGLAQLDAPNNQITETWWTIFTSSVTTLAFSAAGAVNLEAVTVAFAEYNSTLGFAGTIHVFDTFKAYANTSATVDANTSNSIVPAAGDLVIAAFGDTGGNQASITQGTNWATSGVEIGISGTGASALEWQTAAGGSENATITVGTAGQSYTMQIFSFGVPLGLPVHANLPFMSPGRI